MTCSSPRASISYLTTIAIQSLTVLVPLWVLAWAGYRNLALWPSAAIPFGFVRIAGVYLLTGWLLSSWIARRCIPILPRTGWLTVLAIAIGLGAALSILYAPGPYVASFLSQRDWIDRHVIRVAVVLCLQVPWLIAAANFADVGSFPTLGSRPWLDLATAALLVGLTPIIYAEHLIKLELRIYDKANSNQQTVSAWKTVRRLNAFGAEIRETDQSTPLETVRNRLKSIESDLYREIQLDWETIILPLAADASAGQKIDRALAHYRLGDFETASEILSDKTLSANSRARMTHGYVQEQTKESASSVEFYREAISLELRSVSPSSDILGGSYERLANELRMMRRGSEAEQTLREGITRWPEGKQELTYQLGQHYYLVGRTSDAVRTFSEISKLNSKVGKLAAVRIKQIKSDASGCMMPIPQAVEGYRR